MNKIDDFFKKRLSEESCPSEDWNMPSSEIWEKVSPHFPNKKEKNRWMIWVWSFGMFLIIAGTFFYFIQNDLKKSSTDNLLVKENTNQSNEMFMDTKMDKHIIDSISLEEDVNKHVLQATNQNEILELRKSPHDLENETKPNSKSISHSKEEIVNLSISKKENYSKRNSTILNDENPNQLFKSITKEEKKIVNRKQGVNVAFRKNDGTRKNALNKLDRRELTPESLIETPNSKIDLKPSILKDQFFAESIYPAQELGISHSVTLLSFLTPKIQLGSDSLENFSFDITYRNLNLHYSKWLNKRFSLSTGLYLSRASLDLDFCAQHIYDEIDGETSISNNYKDLLNRNSKSGQIIIDNEFIEVNFFPGLEPSIGDTLGLKGKANLGISAIQIPVFLNYHWYSGRFDLQMGTGVTLELINSFQKNIEFQAFDANTPITDVERVADINETYFDYSIYMQTGMRYQLYKRFHAGINFKILVNDPIFSAMDIGVYYRFP